MLIGNLTERISVGILRSLRCTSSDSWYGKFFFDLLMPKESSNESPVGYYTSRIVLRDSLVFVLKFLLIVQFR